MSEATNKPVITIDVSGPAQVGKSHLAGLITQALEQAGVEVTHNREASAADSFMINELEWDGLRGARVEVNEKRQVLAMEAAPSPLERSPQEPTSPVEVLSPEPQFLSFEFEAYPEPVIFALDWNYAPRTCAHFLENVLSGLYDDTYVHSAWRDYVVQGGGYKATPGLTMPDGAYLFQELPIPKRIVHEASGFTHNARGTLSLSREVAEANSGGTQFFVNLKENTDNDYHGWRSAEAGFTAFAQLVSGFETMVAIGSVPVEEIHGRKHVPAQPVVLKRVRALRSL